MNPNNLLGLPETRLDPEPEVVDALAEAAGDRERIAEVVRAHPASSLAWAALAESAERAGAADLDVYAYARIGYHRGLDALRKGGWRGQGPVPWSHEPNRGVLRAFAALERAAGRIGEPGEPERLRELLDDADPSASAAIEAGLRSL